jgi:hypothetical protein
MRVAASLSPCSLARTNGRSRNRVPRSVRGPPPCRDPGKLRESSSVSDRRPIRPGDMQLLREINRQLLRPLRLGDRAVLVEDERLEVGEAGVGGGVEVIGPRVPHERPASARGQRRDREEQQEPVALGIGRGWQPLVQRHPSPATAPCPDARTGPGSTRSRHPAGQPRAARRVTTPAAADPRARRRALRDQHRRNA